MYRCTKLVYILSTFNKSSQKIRQNFISIYGRRIELLIFDYIDFSDSWNYLYKRKFFVFLYKSSRRLKERQLSRILRSIVGKKRKKRKRRKNSTAYFCPQEVAERRRSHNRWYTPHTHTFFRRDQSTPAPLQFPFPANDPWQEVSRVSRRIKKLKSFARNPGK